MAVDLKEYQSFTPITNAGEVPSYEMMVYLRTLSDLLREVQAIQADHEARIAALEP